jgi:hypothetical protein
MITSVAATSQFFYKKSTPHEISNVYLFIYLFLVAKFHNWATIENSLQRVQFFLVAKVAIF